MNNLKYYNDALAYDFQMFMPKAKPEPIEQDNVIKMPSQNIKKHSKAKAIKLRVTNSAFAIFATFVLVGALCANLCLRISVNELNNNINEAKTLLNEKQSESVALQMEYENRISYINLEAEATELGMRKLDQSQVVYIRVNDKNMARTADGKILTSNK
jgi:hypothetical protein